MLPIVHIVVCLFVFGSESKLISTISKDSYHESTGLEMHNRSSDMSVTEQTTKESVIKTFTNSENDSIKFENITESMPLNRPIEHLENVVDLKILNTESLLNNSENSSSSSDVISTQQTNVHSPISTEQFIIQTKKNYHNSNAESTLSIQSASEQKKVLLSKELMYPVIPYHIQSGAGRFQSYTFDRKKISLQHHLQLVPMEDEPLGSMIMKDHKYLISVLVPIGIGMIGAAMIVATVLTLRYVARKRALQPPLDNDTEVDGSITPCISSISTDTTDKIFLLLGDDEI